MLTIMKDDRAIFWSSHPVPVTITEFNIIELLASRPGGYFSCRHIYDIMKGIPGFQAGDGLRGVHSNVRSAVKRIRRKFQAIDPEFDAIVCYVAFGYGWRDGTIMGQRCCPTCGQAIIQSKLVTVPATLVASVVLPEQDNLQ